MILDDEVARPLDSDQDLHPPTHSVAGPVLSTLPALRQLVAKECDIRLEPDRTNATLAE